ncbi:beta-ketoacyl-[acyl-carrier-protein] synthase family protein [Streptomyces sp. WAC04114]|uniref:beta-ketoacyl-[acyl-carrier-protein] synthase family protein n=1 Tax=Streptomyces sp. WAC04114 TaxID=2867961 RepID=UPI001C8C8CFF|nr:beta-ketoacyl-[acyl-carrier-protein] synthase family protein [Streptomyces sp. WAC04114]MBX9363390.1 beta-ketoacyl-[acyl-carrier-protein] synthase family protein [Streptomyces sp. WAC04114]
MTAAVRGRPDIVVTGLGMITPVGLTSGQSWKATCAGRSGAAEDPRLAGLQVPFSCAVTGFGLQRDRGEAETAPMDLFAQYAVAAARDAVADASLTDGSFDPARAAVVLGSGIGGQRAWQEQFLRMADGGPDAVDPLTVPKALDDSATAAVARDLGLHGPSLSVSTACASGTTALGVALDLLRAGRCDVVLAGGTEAAVTPLVSTAFDRLKALSRRHDEPDRASRPFDTRRDGFVMGEGAAVLVLERDDDARARGRRGYARLLGYGASSDAHHLTAPDPEGHGARLALRQALADAGAGSSEVTLVNAHATGTGQGDAVEARLIESVFGTEVAVTSTKGVTGHMLGAAGAVEAAFTALSIDQGLIPPTANFETRDPDLPALDIVHGTARPMPVSLAVSNSFGFGGQNAVVVLGSV